MKKILILLASLTFPFLPHAQTDNFYVENGELIWRSVFSYDSEIDIIEQNLRASGYFFDFYRHDNVLTAELRDLKMDYSGAGQKRMSLPTYIPNDYFYGFVTIEVKSDRYRVTVKRLNGRDDKLGKTIVDNIALTDSGELSDKFVGASSSVFDYTFTKIFSKIHEKNDDEW